MACYDKNYKLTLKIKLSKIRLYFKFNLVGANRKSYMDYFD